MTVIGTNVAAMRAQMGARSAQNQLQTAMERLSTGSRINSAKDDAAGLAISSRMTSQIRGLSVAVRNASDGISMTQTAEGALGEVTNMLQRMKELATQSANATLGKSERDALQAETNQLVSQINDISKTTNFNGLKLLDGSVKSLQLQTGVNSGDTIGVKLASVSASSLGLSSGGGDGQLVSGRVSSTASDLTGMGLDAVTFNGVSALGGTITKATAAGLAEAINANSDKTGVRATAFNTVTTDKIAGTAFATGDLKIGVLQSDGTTVTDVSVGAAGSIEELVDNINRNDFGGVKATLNADRTITFSNSTGADIKITGVDSTTPDTKIKIGTVATAQTFKGFVSLNNESGKDIKVDVKAASAGSPTAGEIGNANKLGFNRSTDGNTLIGSIAVADTVAGGTIATGGLKVNGVDLGSYTGVTTAGANATAIAKLFNDKSDVTGVKAINNANTLTLVSTNGSTVRLEGADLSKIGLTAQGGTSNMDLGLDISSQSAASRSLSTIDKALDNVSAKRGDLGAIQNRLAVTVNSLNTQATNLTDARSRIQDADFSTETTNLAKAQILGQAATAMLAQANQSQQNVLSLLR